MFFETKVFRRLHFTFFKSIFEQFKKFPKINTTFFLKAKLHKIPCFILYLKLLFLLLLLFESENLLKNYAETSDKFYL